MLCTARLGSKLPGSAGGVWECSVRHDFSRYATLMSQMRRNLIMAATLLVVVAVTVAFLGTADAPGKTPHFCRVDRANAVLRATNKRGAKAVDAVLLTNRIQVVPGQKIFARLANFSDRRVGYGSEFSIQRRTRDGWEVDSSSPKGPWARVAGVITPEGVGRCYEFKVPSEISMGSYRFATRIRPRLSRPKEVRRFATFAIR